MNKVDCVFCGHHFETQTDPNGLVRCPKCNKPNEVPDRKIGKSNAQDSRRMLDKRQSIATSKKNKPAQDIKSTQFSGGLAIAEIVGWIGYFMLFLTLIVIVIGMFKGFILQALVASVGIIISGFSLILFSHIAQATMKTADYARICALNSMDD